MDDFQWLFDSLMGYFRSPIWCNPIKTFIDENCVIFDSEDENKFVYTEVHKAFKELVDSLLESFLHQLGISPIQFVQICALGGNTDLDTLVFQYIVAMDDFLTFKKMMEKRNVELELEALKSLKEEVEKQKLAEGETPNESATATTTPNETTQGAAPEFDGMTREEYEELQAALELSRQEMDRAQADQERLERELMEMALAASLKEEMLAEERRKLEVAQLERTIHVSKQETGPPQIEELKRPMPLERQQSPFASLPSTPLTPQLRKEHSEQSLTLLAQAEKIRILKEHEQDVAALTKGVECEKSRQEEVMRQKLEARAKQKKEKRLAEEQQQKQQVQREDGEEEQSTSGSTTDRPTSSTIQPTPLGSIKLTPITSSHIPPMSPASLPPLSARDCLSPTVAPPRAAPSASIITAASLEAGMSELEVRAKHLREQRDRIIEQKKAERDRQMAQYLQETASRKTELGPRVPAQETTVPSDPEQLREQQRLAMRMALVRRFKEDLLAQPTGDTADGSGEK